MTSMDTAYKVAAIAVRQRFAEQHPEDLEILNRLSVGDVAVDKGVYDQVEKILECLKVPVVMNPDAGQLSAHIIFINCPGTTDQNRLTHLAEQVRADTWLVSSDWALGNFLVKAFPDTVGWNNRSTGDEVISVEPSLESLWSEVMVLGAQPQWWLEGSSHPIHILNPDLVKIEAASHELLARYDAPVVAVSFPWGQGQVYHTISHFYCKRSRTPTARHEGPCTDFLKAGMRLSDEGIERVLQTAGIQPETLNFAQMQSAATSTELVAQLCVQAGFNR
jgi:hypothetical protein